MDKPSDLYARLEIQSEKITKYENKIRDLVRAYKSLQNEKTALEDIVNKLGSVGTSEANKNKNSGQVEDGSSSDKLQYEDPLGVNSGELPETVDQLKEKLLIMTKSVAVITDEKKRKEADFHADKKRLNQENEDLDKQLKDLIKTSKIREKRANEEIETYKSRLRAQQLEREKEQNDHQVMLRELQTLLSNERARKENLETQLEEAQVAIAIKESQTDNAKEYKKKITNLMEELKALKGKLKLAEETAGKPSQLELRLQCEMSEAETQHRVALLREHQRTIAVEERLGQLAKVGEDRITGLEARLAELSETVGTYDRQRQQDMMTIQRLKERITQLDVENAALAKAASCVGGHFEVDKEMNNTDPVILREKIAKLKGMLKLSDQQSSDDFNDEIGHSHCHLKFQQLKDEFDNYKMRMMSTVKNKKENDSYKEVESLRKKVSELQETISNLTVDMDDLEKQHRATVNALHTALEETKEHHKQQLLVNDGEWRSKLSNLEQQLQRQRERSFAVLEEKENEIGSLRHQLGFDRDKPRRASLKWTNIEQDVNLLDVAEELSKLTIADKREVPFLHYAQEVARKDVEISNLRKAKHTLEMKVRELEGTLNSKDEEHGRQMDCFAEKVLRLERNSSREGANLEYLKNVVLSYMLSSSATSRQHMLNAIALVLKFSTKELDSVKSYNSTWWWNQKA